MTLSLKDLKHLEVMANLTNAEPVASKPINIKSLLASDAKKELTVSEKILSLCVKLRSEGFEKQAENLENKFLLYKAATTHLYRVFDEDGEDLINAAHPDGEVKVEDAQDGHGIVETVVTEHNKLLDKVNKTPTGKLASLSKYVEQCKIVLAAERQGWGAWFAAGLFNPVVQFAALYKVIKYYSNIIQETAEDFQEQITQMLSNKIVINNEKMAHELNNCSYYLSKIIDNIAQFEAYETSPDNNKKREIILSFKDNSTKIRESMLNLEPELRSMDRREGGHSTLKEISRFFGSHSNYAAMLDTIKRFREALNKVDQEYAAAIPQQDSEISKLNTWKEKIKTINIPEAKKQQAVAWVDSQIKEFQDNANNPTKIKELIEENKEFERQISILEGKN